MIKDAKDAKRYNAFKGKLKDYQVAQEPKDGLSVGRVNFYKLILLYAVGGVLGFLWETFYCSVRLGYYEWRSGMLYSPFNAVYGFGILVLFFLTYKIDKKSLVKLFILGFLAGTLVELVCSYVQEYAFGSVSWDYSHHFLNYDGRISVMTSFVWGVLAIAFGAIIRPTIEGFIAAMPRKGAKIFAICLLIIILVDAALTVSAMWRWLERLDGIAASNAWEEWLDFMYPNARMDFVFPRIQFV